MANITVNVGEIYNRMARMQQIGEDLISYTDQVVSIANSVSTGWTGVNSQEYVDSFNSFKPKILQKCSAILATANGLETTADKISQLQQETNTKIKSLDGGSSGKGSSFYSDNISQSNQTYNSFENSSVDDVKQVDEIVNYTQGDVFKAQSYGSNYTDEEFIQLAAIVGGEDSGSYEGALAVASTMCNRADAGNWGGNDPLTVAKAPNQFVAYNGDLYNKYMNDPSSMPDHVVQATKDALAGTRNTTADSFRAGPGKGGRTQIGDGGNYYFSV